MGTPNSESGDKEARFSDVIMGGGSQKKTHGAGRVDMVSKIDLSVKLDEDSGDEEMESSEGPGEDLDTHMSLSRGHDHGPKSSTAKDEEANSPQPKLQLASFHENGHHGMPFKCEVAGCGSAFRERTQLVSHSLVHRSTTASERSTVEDDSPPSSPPRSLTALNQLQNEVPTLTLPKTKVSKFPRWCQVRIR
jgi:hypothetical protein